MTHEHWKRLGTVALGFALGWMVATDVWNDNHGRLPADYPCEVRPR